MSFVVETVELGSGARQLAFIYTSGSIVDEFSLARSAKYQARAAGVVISPDSLVLPAGDYSNTGSRPSMALVRRMEGRALAAVRLVSRDSKNPEVVQELREGTNQEQTCHI